MFDCGCYFDVNGNLVQCAKHAAQQQQQNSERPILHRKARPARQVVSIHEQGEHVLAVTCPKCGGVMDFAPDEVQGQCWCGTWVYIPD